MYYSPHAGYGVLPPYWVHFHHMRHPFSVANRYAAYPSAYPHYPPYPFPYAPYMPPPPYSPHHPVYPPPQQIHYPQQQLPPAAHPVPPHQPQYSQQLLSVSQLDNLGLPIIPGDTQVQLPTLYRLEERLLSVSRDSFLVRDQQGTVLYKIDGKLSIHERKNLKNANGQILLRLREHRVRIRDRITISSPTNVPILTLQKATAVQLVSRKLNCYTGPEPVGNPALVINGDNDGYFRIVNSQNQEIAIVRKIKGRLKQMMTFGADSFDVTVNYGSPALICFIAVALDEIYDD